MKLSIFKTIQSTLALLFLGSAGMAAQDGGDPFPDFDYHQWKDNMTVTCQVKVNGELQTEGVVVAAYNTAVEGDIRGKQAISSNGRVYLTVFGEALTYVPLHFKVYTGGRIIEVDQGLKFVKDGEYGETANPYIIDLPLVTTTTSREGWATTCLPFNAVVPEGVTVYTGTAVEDGVLKIEPVECSILPKDTPVLLKTEGQASYEWLARVADGDAEIGTNLLKGTTEDLAVEAESVLTLGHALDGRKEIGFWLFTGTTVPANRAYMEKDDDEAGTRGFALSWEDVPTAIGLMPASRSLQTGKSYDLGGRTAAGRSRIRITNGKKVIER